MKSKSSVSREFSFVFDNRSRIQIKRDWITLLVKLNIFIINVNHSLFKLIKLAIELYIFTRRKVCNEKFFSETMIQRLINAPVIRNACKNRRARAIAIRSVRSRIVNPESRLACYDLSTPIADDLGLVIFALCSNDYSMRSYLMDADSWNGTIAMKYDPYLFLCPIDQITLMISRTETKL